MSDTSSSRGQVTIIIGHSGQVVKRDLSASDASPLPNSGSLVISDSGGIGSLLLHLQGDVSMQNGLDGNLGVGTNDLRLKLLRKTASRRAESNGDNRQKDLREKLSRTVKPSLTSTTTGQRLPEPRETGIIRRIPSARSSVDLTHLESMRSSYSPWTLDHIRRRSPDRFPSTSRGISPKRNVEDLQRRPLNRTYDGVRSIPFVTRDVLENSRPPSTTSGSFVARSAALPPITTKYVAPHPGQLPPSSSVAQRPSYTVLLGSLGHLMVSISLILFSVLYMKDCLAQMSNSCRSDNDTSLDVEELLQIGTRCRELKKEKDMLKSSQSQSFELIRVLELHEKSLSEARAEDKKCIQRLEKELLNCSQEIDYLQDQLNARNTEVNYLEVHVHSLESKLEHMQNLQEEVCSLREELQRSNSEQLLLFQELETKDLELQKSTLFVEKLEESISSMALESHCEVESMKLDMMALEKSCLEAKKVQEETLKEKTKMSRLIEQLQDMYQDAQNIIISLKEENEELKEKLCTANKSTKFFSQKVEELLGNKERSQLSSISLVNEQKSNPTISMDINVYGEVLGPLLSRLAAVLEPDADSEGEMEKISCQITEYECLIDKLKEELRVEKLKAKEEADDLAQEMAELRYQITGLLEEECKRRACIEQAALQRIVELEAQLERDQGKPLITVRHLPEV